MATVVTMTSGDDRAMMTRTAVDGGGGDDGIVVGIAAIDEEDFFADEPHAADDCEEIDPMPEQARRNVGKAHSATTSTEEEGPPSTEEEGPPSTSSSGSYSIEDNASFLSSLVLSYLTPLLRLGASRILEATDVGPPSADYEAGQTHDKVACAWRAEERRAENDNVWRRRRWEEEDRRWRWRRLWTSMRRIHGAKADDSNAASVEATETARTTTDSYHEGKEGDGGRSSARKDRLQRQQKPKEVKPNLAAALVKAFGVWRLVGATFLLLLSSILAFVPVLLLNDLVRYFERLGTASEASTGIFNPWVEVVLLGAVPVLVSIMQTRYYVSMQRFAVFVRTSLSTLLYEKSLTVGPTGRVRTSTGQVVNMMSNDTNQIMRFLQFVGMSLVAPVQIVLSLVLIFRQVGHATWVGVGFMILLAPVNVISFAVAGRMRRKVVKHSDERVKMANDILSGIRIIKFYAWERPFAMELGKIRERELVALTKLTYIIQVIFSLVLMSAPIVQIVLVFVTYAYAGNEPLSPSVAFTTVALFNMMRFPFIMLPIGLLQFIQSRIAVQRIAGYLCLPDLKDCVVDGPPPPKQRELTNMPEAGGVLLADAAAVKEEAPEVGSIAMRGASFAWIDPHSGPIKPLFEEKSRKNRRRSSAASTSAHEGGGRRESFMRRRSSGAGGSSFRRPSLRNSSAGRLWRRRSSAGGSGRGGTLTVEAQDGHGIGVGAAHSDPGNDSDPGNGVSKGDGEGYHYFSLRNLTVSIRPGSLVAVVGDVGCGKSSLLSAMLGEMEPMDDRSRVYIPRGRGGRGNDNGSSLSSNFVSYCSQTPWVVNDTLRDNILFGRRYDPERYARVVSACALSDDLEALPAGDMTEIGERGINLSGGQKARVSLARALYAPDVRILLLDDPLSAVDAHVGEHLFERAIAGDVANGATRVLVTHHVHFLRRCDWVVYMEGGRIVDQGPYNDLVERGLTFVGAVDFGGEGGKEENGTAVVGAKAAGVEGVGNDENTPWKNSQRDGRGVAPEKQDLRKSKGAHLMTEEEKEEGSVSRMTYVHYIKAGGLFMGILFLLAQGISRALDIGSSFWLARWADDSVGAILAGSPFTDAQTGHYLNIYAMLVMLSIVALGFRGAAIAAHRMKACRALHEQLTDSVLRAPVAFFDVTPTGRILNRFAHDMDKVDLELMQSLSQGFNTVFMVLGSLGAITAATKGIFLIPMIPLGWVYYVMQRWFRKSSTELQRIFSVTKSPIFADFSQTLTGTATVRAYGEENRFFSRCKGNFDKNNTAYMLVQLSFLWMGLRLDLLGGLIAAFIGGLAVGTASIGFIPAGWLGLALTYSIEITNFLKHGVRMIAQVEADFSSVERVLDYAQNIQPEALEVIPESDPSEGSWPVSGEIHVARASMRYRDGPLVLRDLSFRINGGEKVGVVGRTGSGKSSVMIALLRISELEQDSGKIFIDGIDISQIGTKVLRTNLSIIPQDPVLFSNTVRYNLDPFGDKTDKDLWAALGKVKLAEAIATLPNGLDELVVEGGENFSQGQRQLLCIARSLLRKPKILIMDEATASIDNNTDVVIQNMVRENFSDATVLTIAHRLNTIMDSDRVLVLENGEVVEFDSPAALLSMNGEFAALVEKSRESHNVDNE